MQENEPDLQPVRLIDIKPDKEDMKMFSLIISLFIWIVEISVVLASMAFRGLIWLISMIFSMLSR